MNVRFCRSGCRSGERSARPRRRPAQGRTTGQRQYFNSAGIPAYAIPWVRPWAYPLSYPGKNRAPARMAARWRTAGRDSILCCFPRSGKRGPAAPQRRGGTAPHWRRPPAARRFPRGRLPEARRMRDERWLNAGINFKACRCDRGQMDQGEKKMTIQECYRELGGDYLEVSARLPSPRLIEKFIGKFLEDGSFDALLRAMECGDRAEAFRAAGFLAAVLRVAFFTGSAAAGTGASSTAGAAGSSTGASASSTAGEGSSTGASASSTAGEGSSAGTGSAAGTGQAWPVILA